MVKGIYTAASAMLPQSIKQNTMANNIANLSTPGFKRDNIFYREFVKAMAPVKGSGHPEWFRGKVEQTYTDFSQGQFQQTDRPLDVGIYGDGFFSISTLQGIRYTRNGTFSLNAQGILVDSTGDPVMGEGGPITIPQEAQTISISNEGEIFVDGASIDRLKIVNFPKPYPLVKDQAGGLFMARPGAQEQPVEGNTTINQGGLELSNATGIQEMVDMVEMYRSYESEQRVIQIQYETVGKAISDVGAVKA